MYESRDVTLQKSHFAIYVKGQGLPLHIGIVWKSIIFKWSYLINTICLKLGITTVDTIPTDDIKFGLLRATVMFVYETIRIMKLCHCN